MAHFEIRKILLGVPEVFTNLRYIQISTLTFKLHSTNKIVLDPKGSIIDDTHSNDNFSARLFMQQIRIINEPFIRSTVVR